MLSNLYHGGQEGTRRLPNAPAFRTLFEVPVVDCPGRRIDHGSEQTVSIDLPEKVLLAEKTDAAAFVREMRVLVAVKLYELGCLSSGRAAELAGQRRVDFLMSLGRYKVCPFEAELADLERDRG